MPGIFGPTGREVFQQIQRERAQERSAAANQLASLPASQVPLQVQAQSMGMFADAAGDLGRAAAGTQDPRVERAMRTQRAGQSVLQSGVTPNDPVAYYQALGSALSQEGLHDEANEAMKQSLDTRRELEEQENLRSMIASRRSVKEQDRQAQLDRESRERIAKLRGAARGGAKPKQGRAATASDRKQAEPALRESLGDDAFDALEPEDKKDIVAFTAQRARDIAQANPGLPYEDALEQALQEALGGVSEDTSFFSGVFGEERQFTRPGSAVAPQAAVPATTDEFEGFSVRKK